MVKKNIEFLQPAACIVVGIWPVNRAEQHFLIAKSGLLSARNKLFLHRFERASFSSNKNATAIAILTVFPVDDKVRKREKFLVEDVTIQPGFTD